MPGFGGEVILCMTGLRSKSSTNFSSCNGRLSVSQNASVCCFPFQYSPQQSTVFILEFFCLFVCLFCFFNMLSTMLERWNLVQCQAIHIIDMLTVVSHLWSICLPKFSRIQEKLYWQDFVIDKTLIEFLIVSWIYWGKISHVPNTVNSTCSLWKCSFCKFLPYDVKNVFNTILKKKKKRHVVYYSIRAQQY